MGSRSWMRFLCISETICSFFSIFINSILFLLIIFKSPRKLGAYKYLMIYITIFEFTYSLMDILLSPVHHSHGYAFMIFVDPKNSVFGRETLIVLISGYCVYFGTSMAIFSLHFFYRYLVTAGSEIIKSFTDWRIALWLCLPLTYGSSWGFVAYFICGPTEAANVYMHDSVLEVYEKRIENIAYVSVYFNRPDINGTYHLSMETTVGMAFVSFQVALSFAALLYFGIKCFLNMKKLSNSANCSLKLKGLQSQMFLALVTQTLIPVFLMHIPASFLFLFVFCGIELGTASGIISLTIAIYPALDPLPTIFIINNYRKGLRDFVQHALCRYRKRDESLLSSVLQIFTLAADQNNPVEARPSAIHSLRAPVRTLKI